MVKRPEIIGAFRFAVLARLRVAQLAQGCAPRVDGVHTLATLAQMEIAAGAVQGFDAAPEVGASA